MAGRFGASTCTSWHRFHLIRKLIKFVRTITYPAFQACVNELAKQLANLRSGIEPAAQHVQLSALVVALTLELPAVSSTVVAGHLTRAIQQHLHQLDGEISANFFLAAELPPKTDTSEKWYKSTDMLISLARVPPGTFVKVQPGSQTRSCYSTSPLRQVGTPHA